MLAGSYEQPQTNTGTNMTIEQMLGNLHAMALHTAVPKPTQKPKK